MDDDLPPGPAKNDEEGFSTQLGTVFSGAVWVALFLAIAGGVLYLLMSWKG